MVIRNQILIIVILTIFGLGLFAQNDGEKIDAQSYQVIKPSEIIEDLLKKKRTNPKISAEELAAYGNKLIKEKGYDFSFYACEIAEANKQISESELYNDSCKPYKYQLNAIGQKSITYLIMNRLYEHPCGCGFDIPVFRISDNEMTVLADGKPVKLARPKEFGLDEVELVDRSLNKTLRKWSMPSDNIPFGISKDGTKVYIDTGYDDHRLADLVLEVMENGIVRYVHRNDPNIISRGKELKGFPKDPNNAYLGFLQFTQGKGKYILKFSYPCT